MSPFSVPPSLADCIIKRIQSEHITPKPKWQFQIKNSLFWTMFWLSLVCGSMATTMVIYSLHELRLELLPLSVLIYWFRVLPMYWVGLFLIFTVVAMLGFQKTKHGYKISFLSLMICNLGASLFLGSNIYFWGGADILDYFIENAVNNHESIEQRKVVLWDRPRQGLLAGEIIAVKDGRCWIRSFRGQIWELQFATTSFTPVLGLPVRVTGQIIDSSTFLVEKVTYWQVDPWNRVRLDFPRDEPRPLLMFSSQNLPLNNDQDLLQKLLQQE